MLMKKIFIYLTLFASAFRQFSWFTFLQLKYMDNPLFLAKIFFYKISTIYLEFHLTYTLIIMPYFLNFLNKKVIILKSLDILYISLIINLSTSFGIDFFSLFFLNDLSLSMNPESVIAISQDLVEKYTSDPSQYDLDYQSNLNKKLIDHQIDCYMAPTIKILIISVVGIALTFFFNQ